MKVKRGFELCEVEFPTHTKPKNYVVSLASGLRISVTNTPVFCFLVTFTFTAKPRIVRMIVCDSSMPRE